LISADSIERNYRVGVAFDSGPQYRLVDVHIENATAFSPSELRNQIQMNPGDVFDVSKIRQGIEAISRLYGTKGYIDATVVPETWVDESKRLIDLTLHVNEGAQYRVGTVAVLGLDERAGILLKSLPQRGQVFDYQSFKDFLTENKALLPADAYDAGIKVERDSSDGTADVTFDFQGCSKAQESALRP
jgi:outer membrane protein assembly factor BamA